MHGIDVDGAVVICKRVSRAKVLEFFAALPLCLIGIEACPTAHHWSCALQRLGHTVKLMPPSYVKAYLKRSKNDANDAAAICEAVTDHRCVLYPPNLNSNNRAYAASQPTASRSSTNDAVERDPRAYGRARHYLGERTQWNGRVAQNRIYGEKLWLLEPARGSLLATNG